jgi:MoaA/NifB/PqqE/SkfB family radical SAM enzyme
MKERYLTVGQRGELIVPRAIASRYGLTPGSKVFVEEGRDNLLLHRPVTRLARVYIEPTNRCNLECRTCLRNVWDEPAGSMSEATFSRIVEGLKGFPGPPEVSFGGFGEPLSHPDIVAMVRRVKESGARVELITNGVQLDEERARELIESGLDFLWVSLDGASPDSYADVRLGAALPQILANLRQLRVLKYRLGSRTPHLGVAFVAMKRNLAELPKVAELAARLGAKELMVTNVYPYSAELKEEILYRKSMWNWANGHAPPAALPRMDEAEETVRAVGGLMLQSGCLQAPGMQLVRPADTCPFVERGSTSIRWDGQVSPCLPLLHAHSSYLGDTLRRNQAWSAGSVRERDLAAIWMDPSYLALRERLREFDFSPCTTCNSCEMAESNREDCFGNVPPACGGCLWAQGFIQCP